MVGYRRLYNWKLVEKEKKRQNEQKNEL